MIQSKRDLLEYIHADNMFFDPRGFKEKLIAKYAEYPFHCLSEYLFYLRKQEYYINTANCKKWRGLLGLYYERKKNRLGLRLGLEISPNCFGKGLTLWHGNVVVNNNAIIGEYCTLHGANCIGNNGKNEGTPRIGNNVDIGYGAVIIGDIEIADNVSIGANAVVNHSVLEAGSVVVGVPAHLVNIRK